MAHNHPHPGMTSFKAFLLGFGLTIIHLLLLPKSPSEPGVGPLVNSLIYGLTGIFFITFLSKVGGRKEVAFKPSGMTVLQIQVRAFFLGWSLSCGIGCVASGYSTPLGLYISLLSVFHYTEFLVTSVISPETLSLDSFLLNHSKEYGIAALASVIEFFVEFYFVPSLKNARWVTLTGIAMCMIGEFLRKWAMLTASRNFTHLVRDTKGEGQYLVTSGPYAMFRHPGYAGWFWWSVGTQLVQVNPICTIAYCLAVYKFFKGRIYYEEICLISFFGLDYVEYQKNVQMTGVPFVKGYIPVKDGTIPEGEDADEVSLSESSSDENFERVENWVDTQLSHNHGLKRNKTEVNS